MHKKLDNPVWHALCESHQDFAIRIGNFKFYTADRCPFGAFDSQPTHTTELEKYAELTNNFYIVGERPPDNSGAIKLNKELVCDQMILETPIAIDIKEKITPLNELYTKDLFKLVDLVQPGYFKENTCDLGRYYGVFQDKQLVAVTGERMRLNDYTEISAVVTHPEYTGRGYAKQLVAHVANKLLAEGKTAFLHVADNNSAAIKLYEKLGFKLRRKISFWNYQS